MPITRPLSNIDQTSAGLVDSLVMAACASV
jgi:hypothetical protein